MQVGSITKMRNTSDGLKMVIFTQEGYSVASVLEFVADKPMEASNAIEAVNGFLTDTGKVRILDEYTHSADNYIDIEASGWRTAAASNPQRVGVRKIYCYNIKNQGTLPL